eukprot:scaffold12440_cov60-Phaeocystis_antarctica.AAC.1
MIGPDARGPSIAPQARDGALARLPRALPSRDARFTCADGASSAQSAAAGLSKAAHGGQAAYGEAR